MLERQAKGDFSRDAYPDTFPAYVDQRRGASDGMSCWDLFGAYVAARKPAAGTISRWRAVFKHLQIAFPGSAGALTEENARAWKDTLVTPKRRAVTVDAVWLPAAKTVFAWGVLQKHVRTNPFAGVKIDVPKATRALERPERPLRVASVASPDNIVRHRSSVSCNSVGRTNHPVAVDAQGNTWAGGVDSGSFGAQVSFYERSMEVQF